MPGACCEQQCHKCAEGAIRSLIPFFCSQTFCYIVDAPFDPRLLSSSLLLGFSAGEYFFRFSNCHRSIWLSLTADGLSKARHLCFLEKENQQSLLGLPVTAIERLFPCGLHCLAVYTCE